MIISLIAAMTHNRVIGKNNQMPWHLPADLRHFKNVTMGKPVIMGRKTYESIGRPLPGRLNIVLSRNSTQSNQDGLHYVNSAESALAVVGDSEEVMVIGGEAIYRLFLPLAHRAYLTYIDTKLEGDASFPELDENWHQISTQEHAADEQNKYSLCFTCWEKTNAHLLQPNKRAPHQEIDDE